jgi:chromosome segregation ATPase
MLDYSKTSPRPAAGSQIAASASDSQTLNDNLAKVAVVLDQLSKAVVALREQMAKLEAEVAEVRPQIVAFKVHSESFPHALREVRRSDNEVQKALEGFEARLSALEARERA